MKNSAFEDFSEGCMDAAYEAYDFKTCQRSDGTTYGTHGDCVQKGSKEVSKSSSKKKTSKKPSWDPSDLANKIGLEIGKVAGPAGKGNQYEQRVEAALEQMNTIEDNYQAGLKRLKAGGMTAKQFSGVVAKSYRDLAQLANVAMDAANEQVELGLSNSKYSNRIRGVVKKYLDSYDGPLAFAVKKGHLASKPSVPPLRRAATKSKVQPQPKPSGGGGNTPNLDNVKSTGNLQQDVQNLMGAFMGDLVGGSTADGLSMLDGQSRSTYRWNDGMYRTQDNQNRVQVHSSWEAAKQAASAWHTNLITQSISSGPAGNLQGSREIIRGTRY